MRTSMYSILCIVVRMGAILLAVYTLAALPAAWATMQRSDYDGMRGALFASSALALVLAFVLWVYPGVLARMAAGRPSQQVFESPIGADEIQTIALAVLGVAIAMGSLADLVVYGLRAAFAFAASREAMGQDTVLWLLSQLARVALGCGLALGARGLTALILRLRGRAASGAAAFPPDEAETPQ